MGLSKRHLSRANADVAFDKRALAEELKNMCPEIVFALLMGSAVAGVAREGSDVDLALFVDGRIDLDFHARVHDVVAIHVPGAFCDVGLLNHAEPVYKFEASKGELLFCKEYDRYLSFRSLACREYESQMASYERQLKYRLEAMHAI